MHPPLYCSVPEMPEGQFHKLADQTLDDLLERLEVRAVVGTPASSKRESDGRVRIWLNSLLLIFQPAVLHRRD